MVVETWRLGLGLYDLGRGGKSKPLSFLDMKLILLVAANLRESLNEEMRKLGIVRVLKEIEKFSPAPPLYLLLCYRS